MRTIPTTATCGGGIAGDLFKKCVCNTSTVLKDKNQQLHMAECLAYTECLLEEVVEKKELSARHICKDTLNVIV